MSTETHINQFVREIEEKYKAAVGAVGELKDAIDAFKNKAATMSPELREAFNLAEKELEGTEQKAEATDTAANDGAKASDQKQQGVNGGKS